MKENEKWEKRKLYNGYDCYILERTNETWFHGSSNNTVNLKSISNLDSKQRERDKRRITILTPPSSHEVISKCDIILVQNYALLGFIEINIYDNKTATLTGRDSYLSSDNLPSDIKVFRDFITPATGTAITVNPNYRR